MKKYFIAEYRAIARFRVYSYFYNTRFFKLLGFFLYQRSKKFGADIAPTAIIGKNFEVVHLGGIVIGKSVTIGDNVKVQSCVTIGMKTPLSGMPNIGNDVYIGTGAKLLGDIKVSSGAVIGANAVVTKDVAKNEVAVGVPFR